MTQFQVIVLSGVTAGGKTTLIKQLEKEIPHSFVLSFDDYSIDTLPSAPSFEALLKNPRQAINQYDISQLMADFLAITNNYQVILVDFPFGYQHEVLAKYIDKVIYLKTPLDVTFARQILRDYSDKSAIDIRDWASKYLTFARPIFLSHEALVSSNADLLLDGLLPLSEQVRIAKSVIFD